MKTNKLFFILMMIATINANAQSSGKLEHYENFNSEFVDARNVDIWLPKGYDESEGKTFPVIYMHDGQNLFNPETSYGGVEWGVDEVITKLSSQHKIPEAIVVGIWNTPKRYQEYMPQKVFTSIERSAAGPLLKKYGGMPVSDNYLKFIVEELKPFVDSVYRTKPERTSTYMMGSSMGGLISIYALCEYPQIFRGAGCLSSHWIGDPEGQMHAVSDAFVKYLSQNLPDPGGHLIYFDYGTATLDSLYEPHQQKIDNVMRAKGYVEGKDWITKKYEGAEHNEASWRKRLDVPLLFLMRDEK